MIPKGKLLIIGGKEDKNGTGETESKMEEKNRDFSPDEILKLLAQSKDDRIEVITTASSDPEEMKKTYQEALSKIGYTNFDFLHVCDEQVHTDYHLKRISDAKTVFFTGGDQNKMCQQLKTSVINDLLLERYWNDEGFTIAGTSAGAMCMPEIVISDAVNGEAMLDHDIKLTSGLGLIKNCIVDTHFIHRGRFGRLAHAAILHPHHWGIGLGEDTAMLIEKGCEATCQGSGMAVVISAKNIKQTNAETAKKGNPVYAENLTVHLLTDGCCINLNEGKMTIPQDN